MTTISVEATESHIESGLKILSLDAGGAQAVSQLQILDHVMERISQDDRGSSQGGVKRPCEVFDVIGGVGSGGLIAIFLVILKMTAQEAVEQFTEFALEMYKDPNRDPTKQTEKLKQMIYCILERRGISKCRELILADEPVPTCSLVVPIMYKNNIGATCVLRNQAIRQELPTNHTITDAMLATSATIPLFTPISMGKEFSKFEYISGDLGLSNPIREIIASAHQTFGDEATVACLLSIGSGHPGIRSVPSTSDATTRIDFLERVAMDSEKAAQEMAMQLSQLTIYHRFSVNYGLERLQPRAWQEPEAIATHATVYLNDLETVKVIDRCVDAIKTGNGSATLEQLRGANLLPVPLPPLTTNYVERKVPMEFIEKAVFDQNRRVKSGSKLIVVTGIGGCGKTQLVRKFIENNQDQFASTFVVDGSGKGTLRRDLIRHVRSINPAHSQDSFEESMAFLSRSIPDGQRLLIIDNVDDPSLDLSPFLPRWMHGAVVMTSRNASRGQLCPGSHLQLDVMSLDESVELLIRGSGREWPPSDPDREAAMSVARELGYHPIALVQAISYMAKTGYSADIYMTRLRSCRDLLLKDPATNQLDMRYLTAFAAFDASYDILSPNAQNTLHILSFFHRLKFPLDLVTLAASDDFSTEWFAYIPRGQEFELGKGYLKETFSSSGRWNLLDLDQIVSVLRNQSLITVLPAQNITLLEMHSLVHEWSRIRVPKEMIGRVQSAAIRLLCCGAKKDNYRMMQYLGSHIQALFFAWEDLHTNDAASFSFILEKSGMYADATELRENVYGMVKSQRGVDHHDTLKASASVAVMYWRLGRYADAEVRQVEVLRQFKQRLGVDHPDTIFASENLANTYNQLGRYNDALALQLDVLAQRKRLLRTDHPDTIAASAHLAATYWRLGLYADAEVLQVWVLRKRKQLLGVDHPDTIKASANLAITYHRLGRYNDALGLMLDVLRQRKQLLGVDHPDTIMASANLANTYNRLGRYNDALALKLEVLKQRKRLLGVDHPDTIMGSENLANTYNQLGRYNDVQFLQLDVLARRKRLLGTHHPDTIAASGNLAHSYAQLGRYAEAEKLQIEVLRLSTSILGDRHPDTLLAMANLALTYKHTHRGPEGTKLAQMAREVALETLEDNSYVSQRISWVLAHAISEVVPSRVEEPAC